MFAIEFSLRARGLQINRMILKADEKKEREWYFFLKKVGATFAPIQYEVIEVDDVDKVASELEVLLKERMLKEYLQGNYLYCYELQRQQAEIEAGLAHYGRSFKVSVFYKDKNYEISDDEVEGESEQPEPVREIFVGPTHQEVMAQINRITRCDHDHDDYYGEEDHDHDDREYGHNDRESDSHDDDEEEDGDGRGGDDHEEEERDEYDGHDQHHQGDHDRHDDDGYYQTHHDDRDHHDEYYCYDSHQEDRDHDDEPDRYDDYHDEGSHYDDYHDEGSHYDDYDRDGGDEYHSNQQDEYSSDE